MLKRLAAAANKMMQRYLPDPFLFAVILSLVVFVAAIVVTRSTPQDVVAYWGNGFWGLLEFTMQMVLILVTGHVMASSSFFERLLARLARSAKTGGQAILLVTLISLLASWINWGFGLVIGALFAKQLARYVQKIDYRLLIASAYSGFIVWHGGLAGSVPLTIATEGHFAQNLIGVIPTDDTIFAPFNLVIVATLFVVVPIVNRLMLNPQEAVYVDPQLLTGSMEAATVEDEPMTPATRLENSQWLSLVVGLLGIAYIMYYLWTNGFNLNLNIVNFTFLFVGILLHRTPRRFLVAVQQAVKGAGGIIIQFPFYAGLMGIMVDSGLAKVVSEAFVAISNEVTFPLFSFLSAGFVNIFVPSGGGQWAVQGPIMLAAGNELGVSAAKTAMAVAWGDAWTNLIQPFWALPALAIAGLKARDIMGFCIITLFISGAIIGLGLLLL